MEFRIKFDEVLLKYHYYAGFIRHSFKLVWIQFRFGARTEINQTNLKLNSCRIEVFLSGKSLRQTDRNLSLPQQSFMPVFINQIKLHCSFSSIWLLLPSLAASNYLIQFNFQIKPDCSLIEIEWINLIAAMK